MVRRDLSLETSFIDEEDLRGHRKSTYTLIEKHFKNRG